jgi:hypothetical protein
MSKVLPEETIQPQNLIENNDDVTMANVTPIETTTDQAVATYTTNPTQNNAPTATVSTTEKKSYCRQTYVLTKKNFLVQLRNKTATAAQLGVGVLFILLLLVMDIAVKENNKNNDWYIETRDPIIQTASDFTKCTSLNGKICYSLFLYGDSFSEVQLASEITTLLDLPAQNVEQGWNFVNKSEYPVIKDYLFANLNVSRIGLEFNWPVSGQSATKVNSWENGDSSTVLPTSYILHYNGTRNCGDLGIFNCEQRNRQLLVPLMTAVDSVLLRKYALNYPSSSDTARITASFTDFPHPA